MKQLQFLTRAVLLGALAGQSVASADVVVIVSPRSTLKEISAPELAKIFLGREQKINGVKVVAADQRDGATRAFFHEKVTRKNLAVLRRYWARQIFSGEALPPIELESDAAVKQWVSTTENGVGYIDAGSVDGSVKVISRIASK